MLVLSRKDHESVVVGDVNGFDLLLRVTVLDIRGGKVRLGFEASVDFPVHRGEVWERIRSGVRRTPMGKTNVERRNYAWFALADAKHCRLLYCHLTKQGTQHVDEYDALQNTLPQQEHMRPMTQSGTTHDIEEEERRFAGEIVEWLQEKTKKHEIDRLAIFAPPRMLGVLRKASSRLLKGHLEELNSDLMRLDSGQLAQHPLVRDLVRAVHERSLGGGSVATTVGHAGRSESHGGAK